MCRIILSGPFCTGKTSIIKLLSEKHNIPKLIDETTRPMRKTEQPGFPYHFINEMEFQKRLANHYYFETVNFNGFFYGVPKNSLFEHEKWSLDILASSWKFYKDIPEVIGIYLEPPAQEILIQRARLRGDSEEHIANRLLLLQDEKEIDFPYRISAQISLEQTLIEIEKIIF
jgi:guanylate kinase